MFIVAIFKVDFFFVNAGLHTSCVYQTSEICRVTTVDKLTWLGATYQVKATPLQNREGIKLTTSRIISKSELIPFKNTRFKNVLKLYF